MASPYVTPFYRCAFDEVRSIDKKSIVIVVSPLVSLTMDQVRDL